MNRRRVFEPSNTVVEFLKYLAPPGAVNARIHEDDEMFVFTARKNRDQYEIAARDYLRTGKVIADSVSQFVKWKFGGFEHVNKFLDFACGYGRVTRFLVPWIEPARIWVSDITAAAVEFQQANLGVHGFVSVSDPDALQVKDRFDCILVVSLFTHLPQATFVKWLEKLYGLLAPHGLLIISVHDEYLRGGARSADPAFWFEEVSEMDTLSKQDYGTATVNESYVRAAIAEATQEQGSYLRLPRGLNRHQDFYLIAGRPAPDFDVLLASLPPEGHVDLVSLIEPDLLRVTGWAFAHVGTIGEVRVTVGGDLIQSCRPEVKRSDVMRHFENPNAELSGFSCDVRLPRKARSIEAAPLNVAVIDSGGQPHVFYHQPLGTALQDRHR
jgi:SAM-dependent methyltransferase